MKLIVAVNMNNVIGRDGEIPWVIKEDLSHFYKTTVDNIVIMGRKTYESLEKPLTRRYNIVLTSEERSSENKRNLFFANNLEQVIEAVEQKWKKNPEIIAYVIGGSFVYDLFLKKDLITEIILTQVWNKEEGDTHFQLPEGWRISSHEDLCEEATIYRYKKVPNKRVRKRK